MLLQRVQFVIPLRDVFCTIVIDEFLHADLLKHRGALLRPALGLVVRHDAPGGEIGLVEDIFRRRCGESQTGE